MDMTNMSKRKQPQQDVKILTLGHTWVFNERRGKFIPHGRLQLSAKQYYTQIQRNSCPYILQQDKSELKVKMKQC